MNYNSAYGVGSIGYDPYNVYAQVQSSARANTLQSQANAERQMKFQTQANAAAMDFNSLEAAKNRDWQEYMSNTAHQREVQDLIAAGLNPVLSASGGNGAAVGSGATASGVTSSGASGMVDTALTAAIPTMFNNILQAQVALEGQKTSAASAAAVAGINAEASKAVGSAHDAATRYAADSAYKGTVLDAAVGLEKQGKEHEHEEYMAKQYPTTWAGLLNAALDASSDGRLARFITDMTDALTNKSNPIENIVESVVNGIKKIFEPSEVKKQYEEAGNVAGGYETFMPSKGHGGKF